MARRQPLSHLEWELMNVIWDLGGRPTVREVLQRAYPRGEKAYTTVQTVMNNLEKKGYLEKEKIGLVNFYRPTIRRGELQKGETSRFVKRVFDGSVPALASYLIRSASLSEEELRDLRALLDQKTRPRDGDA